MPLNQCQLGLWLLAVTIAVVECETTPIFGEAGNEAVLLFPFRPKLSLYWAV